MELLLTHYLENYKTYKKHIIYRFEPGDGGIGDFTKFFLVLLDICIKKEMRIYYFVGNGYMKNHLRLTHEDMYITKDQLPCPLVDLVMINDLHTGFDEMEDNKFYVITSHLLSGVTSTYELYDYEVHSFIDRIFYFSEEVKENARQMIDGNQPYISIHLRLGDRYLEIDRNLIHCLHDVRQFNEGQLFEYIERNKENQILFFCDNHSYKLKLKEKYENILITNYEIGHTTYIHTSPKQVVNTISEFFLLSKSQSIYTASYSGFSIMASKFHNVPLVYPSGGRPPAP